MRWLELSTTFMRVRSAALTAPAEPAGVFERRPRAGAGAGEGRA